MERSSYNRGGNGTGHGRGGRSSGVDGSGGSGEDSRGLHPRGGRTRNHPQRYMSNRQQEQYGGGHGGGGQQTSRSRTYPRQPADQVPVRSGPGREARTWYRLGAGEPAESPSRALTQTQSRLADVQIREVPHVSSFTNGAEHSMDEVEKAYVPIRRPDNGTLAVKSVRLLVNHFPVMFDPSNTILRYDVDVKHEGSSSSTGPVKKSIPKSDLRLIQGKLCSDYPDQFPLLKTAFDGEKNVFSADLLHPGSYKVQLFGRSYICTIKFGNELGLSKLQDFLSGNAMQIPRDVLQALDVVMKASLFREKVSIGRGMYPRAHRPEDDLHCGVAASRGSLQSLKITSNGLALCSDYSAIPFRKRMPVIDFLKEHIRDIQEVNDIARFGYKVKCALKGLRVSVTHRPTNQKYIIAGLTEKVTRHVSFEQEDPEGKTKPEKVMLTDYFHRKWGKEVAHKDIPCLELGHSKKPNYVPMEFCVLAEDRRFPKEQLGWEAARKLRELCLLPPDSRRTEICSMVREEYGTKCERGAAVLQNFELGVAMNMTAVDGCVMPPPKLKLGTSSGRMNTTTVDKFKCHWNLLGGKSFVLGEAAERWAVIDFSSADRQNRLNADMFIVKLMNRCRSLGVRMENPVLVHQTNMREFSDVNRVRRLLSRVVEECSWRDNGRLQMIVCVMADRDVGYKYLKWVSEIEIGVITQCCLSKLANQANDQYLVNLALKINVKLGGSNVELVERLPHFHCDDHVMFVGADVNHPAASNTLSPSIAAVVGSVNAAATRYAARVSPQSHRKEEIVDFGKMCLDLVNTYARLNGVKPNKIVVFRDGVSDGQFDMVLNKEMVDMKKAIYNENYRPVVTFVVAQKRHTTRLFLANERGSANVPPGTVVDTTIAHPFLFDFYLCSHFGSLGTSKPTHYTVIWDENGFSSDEIQKLVYHLCYVFARCTKPVSLVPPVYYADLVAYRGRMFQEVVMELQSSAGSPSSFDQFFYNLEHHLKDSMFFV